MMNVPSRRFTLRHIAPRVWAAIGNRAAGVSSNAGIVDLENVTLVVDSFLTLQAAEELRTAARLLTGRDPSALVNTHWHLDHWLGNIKFDDCEIYSSLRTQELILERGPAALPALLGEVAASQLRRLEERERDENRPLYREELISEVAARRDLYEEYRALRVRAPNQTYATRYNLPALQSAWFVEVRGHTESDTMVFVPEAEVLFTGDIITVGTHPNLTSGELDPWFAALDGVEKIDPKAVVPGHGPPGDLGAVQVVREYLSRLRKLVREGGTPVMPEPYRGWLSPSLFDLNLAALH